MDDKWKYSNAKAFLYFNIQFAMILTAVTTFHWDQMGRIVITGREKNMSTYSPLKTSLTCWWKDFTGIGQSTRADQNRDGIWMAERLTAAILAWTCNETTV